MDSRSADGAADTAKILVCQNTTCQRQGSAAVLRAFQEIAPATCLVEASGCLGHCGNGPMVLILPEQIWYNRVQPWAARSIGAHLWGQGRPPAVIRPMPSPAGQLPAESSTAGQSPAEPLPAEPLPTEPSPDTRRRWLAWGGIGILVSAIAAALILGLFWLWPTSPGS